MATLKIPQLNLFNHSRKIDNNNRSIYEGLTNISENAIKASERQRISYPQHHNHNLDLPSREYEQLYFPSYRQPHLPHRYRDIADMYLDKRIPLPIYPQPLPYIQPLTLYNARSSRYSPGPILKQCQCEREIINRKPIVKKQYDQSEGYKYKNVQQPFNSPYINNSQYNTDRNSYNNNKNSTDLGLIKKDPYLIATFRKQDNSNLYNKVPTKIPTPQNASTNNFKNNPNMIRIQTNQSVHVEDKNISAHFQVQKVPVSNAQVQTNLEQQAQKNKSMMLISKVIKKAPGIMDQKNFKKAIIQQTNEFYKIEFQKQEQYRIDFSDLQQTKDQYFEKSRQLLFRLNELSEDKKQFAIIGKLFMKSTQKKPQISWPTQLK